MSKLPPGIEAAYRADNTPRLIKMLDLAKSIVGTDRATARTPVTIAVIEGILRERGVGNV